MKKEIIRTENLCKSYVTGKTSRNILKNINVSIYEGDFTIIMGTSGSGKSTLLYAISSMDQPTCGEVWLSGIQVSGMSEKEAAIFRRDKVSFIFQSMNLIPDLTSFENVAYPAYQSMPVSKANERSMKLLERFGLSDQMEKYPNEMSGGQQQRVAIARALATDADVIFGDEPTGALNSASGKQVLDILTELNEEGKSIVMVTHDIKACARGSRLLFLEDGRIAEDLSLGKYRKEDQKEREEIIFQYLKKNQW